jgi:phasin family protein
MAARSTSKSRTKTAAKPAPKKTSAKPRAKAAPKKAAAAPSFAIPGVEGFGKLPKALTPEQAIELYKANARIALDVINAAIDSTAKMRRLQFAGEEEARAMHKKAMRNATEAPDPQALVAAGRGAAQEAMEKSMRYWGEMFELIVEMQKRLFTLIEDQTAGMPGVKQAKAAMAMMPDVSKMQNVVSAMQGVMSSGGSAFESMQKVMNDFASMTSGRR